MGLHLADQAGRIVAAAFDVARTARRSADILVLHIDLHRIHALRVIRAGGRSDDDELIACTGLHAQMRLGGDGERTQIEAGVRFSGHPVFVHADERLDSLYEILHGDFRNAQAPMGALHTGGVLFRPEQQHAAIRSTVGFHALKALLRIMKHQRGRVQLQGMVRLDARRVPATALGVVHDEHMVRVMVAEAQMLLVRLCLRRGGLCHFDVQHTFPSSIDGCAQNRTAAKFHTRRAKEPRGLVLLYFSRPAAILQGADR